MQKDFGGLMTMMAANTEVFSRVPAGLAHCKPLVDTMETNVDNYGQVSSLPNFNLFTFFFMCRAHCSRSSRASGSSRGASAA